MSSFPHHTAILKPICAAASLLALGLAAAPASADSFTASTNLTAAQTLNKNETGTVNPGKSLTVGSDKVAVTIKGDNAKLANLGTISQTGTGRAVRDNTGVKNLIVINGSLDNTTALMQTADADVIQMNVAGASVTLDNYGSMISLNASAGGSQAVDFNAVTGSNVVNNHAGALLKATEADAVRPGVNGVVNNAGTIRSVTTTGSSSDGIDGQANSGIQVFNLSGGLVDGARHGITASQDKATTAFTITIDNAAGAIIRGNNGSGLNIDGFNGRQLATITNAGTIIGNGITGDGDGVDVDGLVNLTNTGLIRSTNAWNAPADGLAYSEGISVGGGTIVNAGTIEGLVAAGNKNAVGRGITLAGNDITSGPLAGTREGLYGNASITNQAGGIIRGQGDSGIVAVGAASGFTVTINNNAGALIAGGGTTTAAIRAGADQTYIVNAGTIDGSSSGRAIQLGSANGNTVTILGPNAQVLGGIDGGTGSGSRMIVDAGAGNAFAYGGAISHFAGVEFRSGTTTLSGQSTYDGQTILSGGTLVLDGANRLSAASALVLGGGTLDVSRVGAGGQSFASLSLTDSSIIDIGGSSLSFGALGTVTGGKTLQLVDVAGAPTYVLRFAGNYTDDATFRLLMQGTTLDSRAARYSFDGTWTNVTVSPVPEPSGIAMMLCGLGLAGILRRRSRAVHGS